MSQASTIFQSAPRRPIAERGTLPGAPCEYGRSVDGAPLQYWPSDGRTELLIFAGIHGEEPDSTVLLSRALRSLGSASQHCAVITCANPDGLARGTRGNANGVDLNRNFPTGNWREQRVIHKWSTHSDSCVQLSPGVHLGSEPETQALMALIQTLQPDGIISMHAPLGLIDDPEDTPLGRMMAHRCRMPHTVLPTSETPGSFGSWSVEQGFTTITYELPNTSIWDLPSVHMDMLCDILAHGLAAAQRPPLRAAHR